MLTVSDKEIALQMERMNDSDPFIRREAIGILTGIKDARVLYPLVKALQEEDQGIQQAAMDALIAFEDETAVYNVLPLLSDGRPYVRNLAREILDKIGVHGIGLFSLYFKDKDEDVRKMIADILGNIKRPEAVALLLEMLKDPCSNVRCSAAEGLGRIGDSSVVQPLIDLLIDEEWVALFAAGALGMIGDSRAVKPLIPLIASTNIEVQIMAIEALGHIGGEGAIEGLLGALNSASPEAMSTVIKGIVRLAHGDIGGLADRFGKEKIFGHLVHAIDDSDMEGPDVKINFIRAFSSIGSSGSSTHILKLVSEIEKENIDILEMAAGSLEILGEEDILIEALGNDTDTCVLIAIRVLGLLRSSRAVPDLIRLFREVNNRDVEIEILFALGMIGGSDSSDLLIEMVSQGEGHIRGAAARSLGIMAAPETAELLLDRIDEEEYHDVVEEIAKALIEITQRNSIPSLVESLASKLSSRKPYVREVILKGLGRLGWPKIIEHAKSMLNDESWRVRRACLETLGYLNAEGIIDILITAASDEKDEIRMIVAQMAVKYPEEKAADLFISLLSDRNSRIKYKAIEGLAKLKAAKAIPYLIEMAGKDEPSVQKASIWALGELAAGESEEILKSAVRHYNPEIRDVAIEAYRKIKVTDHVIH